MSELKDLNIEIIKSAINKTVNMKELAIHLGFSPQHRTYDVIRKLMSDAGLEIHFDSNRENKSILLLISKNELLDVIEKSSSYSQVLRFFGLRVAGSNLRTLKNVMLKYNIPSTELDQRRSAFMKESTRLNMNLMYSTRTFDDVKKCNFSTIRNFILKNKLLEYKCQIPECGNEGFRFGKPLTLELDHIDGDRFNNELHNLRFLCPSCHSQTETFAGKARYKKVIKRCECGKVLSKDNLSGKCSQCASKSRVVKLKFEVTKVELETLLAQHSLTKIGEMFGVSDNAIRRRCRKLEIDFKSISKYSHKKFGRIS